MIDLSLSDESHAQHDDSSDQDLDEKHRIGGLGIDSNMVQVTSGSQKILIFRGLDFRLGGSLGIDWGAFDHPGILLRTDPDPPIPEGQKSGGYAQRAISWTS